MLINNNSDYNFYHKNGFIVKSIFKNNEEFLKISKNLKQELTNYFKKNSEKIKSLGGYKSGNLNFISIKHSKQIIDLLNTNNFEEYFNHLTQDNLKNYEIMLGGNLNFPKSKNQFFHTDGKWNPRMIILNIATSDIKKENGPMEIINESHKIKLPYWKFILKSPFFKKEKIFLDEGELLIREHRLWHRGTTNYSTNMREMLGIIFIKKKIIQNKPTNLDEEHFSVFSNIFGNSKKEKFKEFIFLKLKFLLFFYKIFISIKKKI